MGAAGAGPQDSSWKLKASGWLARRTATRRWSKALPQQDAFGLICEEIKRGWWDASLVNEFEAVLLATTDGPNGPKARLAE